jgi:hypothetical protein
MAGDNPASELSRSSSAHRRALERPIEPSPLPGWKVKVRGERGQRAGGGLGDSGDEIRRWRRWGGWRTVGGGRIRRWRHWGGRCALGRSGVCGRRSTYPRNAPTGSGFLHGRRRLVSSAVTQCACPLRWSWILHGERPHRIRLSPRVYLGACALG